MPELKSGQWVQGLKMLTPDQTHNKKTTTNKNQKIKHTRKIKRFHVNINNNINKIITAMTKNISSNHAAFSRRQFNADTYHNSTLLPLRVSLIPNRTTLICVKRYYVMKPICGR